MAVLRCMAWTQAGVSFLTMIGDIVAMDCQCIDFPKDQTTAAKAGRG